MCVCECIELWIEQSAHSGTERTEKAVQASVEYTYSVKPLPPSPLAEVCTAVCIEIEKAKYAHSKTYYTKDG